MKRGGLLTLRRNGLYCAAGDFYIDPWGSAQRAVLTHAHSDHAYRGNKSYLVAEPGRLLYKVRLGEDARIETAPYGQAVNINGVSVSFHPAGHVLGSAQVRIEHKGEIWVVSGDYKLTPDPTCAPFEPVRCHHFITEATFGLPIYRWPSPDEVFAEINNWWRRNRDRGKATVIFAYSLGKAQRVLAGIDPSIGQIFTHGAVERLTEAYRDSGVAMPETKYVGSVLKRSEFAGSLIVAPPSAQQAVAWLRRFGSYSSGFASGWMMVRGARRQRAVDRGFVLSDHADWPELLAAIASAEAETVYVTHGFSPEVVRWLNEHGTNAVELKTRFVGDASEEGEPAAEDGDHEMQTE